MNVAGIRDIDTSRTHRRPRTRIRPRGIPPGLAAHPRFEAKVVVDAEHAGVELLGPHRLRITATNAESFHASLHAVRLRDIELAYLDYQVPIEIICRELTEHQLVLMPTNGSSTMAQADVVVSANTVVAACPRPSAAAHLTWSGEAPHLIVLIRREAIERWLSRTLGRSLDEPVVLEPSMDLADPTAARWHGALQLLHSELTEPGTLTALGRGDNSLQDFFVSSLLLAQPSNYSSFLHDHPGSTSNQHVQRAMAFVERHLAEQIGVGEIAEAIGLSARSVQMLFRDSLGCTPTAYVRDLRLEKIHEELVARAGDRDTSVTDVAFEWGFTHPGRFAAAYKRRYGVSPSTTLRGTRTR
ncbi:MAG: AraC family transcriptional regulator [Actinomycetota bacterium]